MKLEITPTRCWLANQPIDFRCGINSLCQHVLNTLEGNPKDGVFIFYSKDRKKLKLLSWHRNGFVMVYKQFCRAQLTPVQTAQGTSVELSNTNCKK